MQTHIEKFQQRKFLIISLFTIAFGILITNLISEDAAILFASWSYVITAGSVVVLSIIIARRAKLTGTHGKAWILFAGFAMSWFTAEMIWDVYELILEIDPYPSEADFFWLVGYPLYFGFMIFYLQPFKKLISKKMIVLASVFSIILLTPALYLSYDFDLKPTDFDNVLVLSYPLLDSIVLVPALIGVFLFLTGKVNFLWTLMCLAIICSIAADIAFFYSIVKEDYYYSGHPVEILFHWAYILFAFGVYDHYKIFKIKNPKQDKLI